MAITPATVRDIIDAQANCLKNTLDKYTGAKCGVAVAFYYPADPDIPDFYSYGVANEAGDCVTETTVFAIGSVTKTFTATLLANAILSVKPFPVGLNQSAADFLPATAQPSAALQDITLIQLATHTSGLPRSVPSVGSDAGFGLFQKDPSTPSGDLLDYWQNYAVDPQSDPPSYSPGSCWLYSDLGFITLGYAAVGANAGSSYADLLASVITTPLGMPNTAATLASSAVAVTGHYNDQSVDITRVADLKSTAQDMYAWLEQNLLAMGASDPSQLQQALTMTTTRWLSGLTNCGAQTSASDMGLAWEFADKNASDPTIIWKDGEVSAGGCSCWLGMIPASESAGPMGIAILANGWVEERKKGVTVEADPYGRAILLQIAVAA